MDTRLKITKLDAAKRQLEMAIELYFLERDPVSIHTLAAAAYELLSDLNRHRGGKPLTREWDGMKDFIVPGKEKLAKELISQAENFFKHADRDPEKVIDFNPEYSMFVLWESCLKYTEMTGEQTHSMQAMNFWFQVHHPEIFNIEEARKRLLGEGRGLARSVGKAEFYRQFLTLKLQPARQ